jgi:hypothetical protein
LLSVRNRAAVAALTVIAVTGIVTYETTQTGAAADVHHPCPSGMVCIYKGGVDTTAILRGYYVLGPHYLHLDRKEHLVVNKLWDQRRLTFKDRARGEGHTVAVVQAGSRRLVNFTKVRSLVLQKSCPVKTCFTKIPQ